MNSWEAFYGPNVGYALELYERFLQDPGSVDEATRAFFNHVGQMDDAGSAVATLARPATRTIPARSSNGNGQHSSPVQLAPAPTNGRQAQAQTRDVLDASVVPSKAAVGKVVMAARLARSIREFGHYEADIDPLGAPRPGDPMLKPETHGLTDGDLAQLPASIVWPSAGPEIGTCLDAIRLLRQIYSGPIGYDFDHVQDFNERAWLHAAVEAGTYRTPLSAEQKKALLWQLTQVEGFERFLHTVFQGQKRFSIEGNDTLVPMLEEVVRTAEGAGVREVLIGMAHRGRLNVLAHVLERPYAAILAEFQSPQVKKDESESDGLDMSGGGDVKYHRGACREVKAGDDVRMAVTLADNPSHLEYVNAAIEGFTRAAQDIRTHPGTPGQDVDAALAVSIHGDASFPGEGVVAETLNLSHLPGYQTGGTLHFIVNNQVGFTTGADEGRSTLYASDLAKGFEIPIVHVNADDPEACLATIKLAIAYRRRFHKDFLIDLVGYRRWGHNEGDEPGFTQPRMYDLIRTHPTVRQLYAERLEHEGVITREDAESMLARVQDRMREGRDEAEQGGSATRIDVLPSLRPVPTVDTAIPADQLRALNEALLQRPDGFTTNPKLERVLARRRDAIEKPDGIDWAMAEALAFASILADGTPIRLTGQDVERGTFSQRHLVLHDPETGHVFVPLQHLPQAQASFAVYNSPLTEAAVMGFEYGYSVHAPDALVLWEAQYGDFANAGQVLIDQFISAARTKWQAQPSLGMLLPHGYEGQGPEHSSARLERYLQLSAEDNMVIVNLSNAAQYFHLLRRHAAMLKGERRPLVVMTPKSLLRHPLAASSLRDFTDGSFQTVIDDVCTAERRSHIERVVFCTGKVAIDLATTIRSQPVDWIATARLEQIYPFPTERVQEVIAGYPNLREVVWLQEEPRNMGACAFVAPKLQSVVPRNVSVRYIGRPDRASTAAGSPLVHAREQAALIHAALAGERQPQIETREDEDVD